MQPPYLKSPLERAAQLSIRLNQLRGPILYSLGAVNRRSATNLDKWSKQEQPCLPLTTLAKATA